MKGILCLYGSLIRPCLAMTLLLFAGAAFGESSRTAVLTSEALRDTPYGVLLSVALSERGVELVERSELDRVVAEQELSAFGGDAAASRIRIGHLLGARYLALLDRPTEGGGQTEAVRLRVIDVATGLRLGGVVVPVNSPEAVEASVRLLADAVTEVRDRFPKGVESVVAVTPWLSENLTREYDGMQTALAELLSTALQSQKGLAVVEIDEARRVARERELGGTAAVSSPMPWGIEGHFSLQPVKPDEARKMDLSARIYRMDAEDNSQVWRQDNVPLEHVGAVVTDQTASAVLRALSLHAPDQPAEIRKLFEALIGRADRFSTVGMWAEAASLREAALVADPDHEDAAAQRRAVAWNYARLLGNGFMRDMPNPNDPESLQAWITNFRQSHAHWRRALWHAEYLIMNRQIDDASALDLAGELLAIPRRSRDIRDGTSQVLIAADRDRRRFLLNVLPRVHGLPADGSRTTVSESRLMALALDAAVNPYYGRLTQTDLNLFATLLHAKLPADLPPNGQFVRYQLGAPLDKLPKAHYSGATGPEVEAPVSAEQWQATMRELAAQSKQERPAAWALGEYALLAQERWRLDPADRDQRQALYERVRELQTERGTLSRPGAGGDDGLAAAIQELRTQLRTRPSATSSRGTPPTSTDERPEEMIDYWLEPVSLRIRGEDGRQADANRDWFDVLSVEGAPQGLLNIWVGLRSVYFERELGLLDLVFELPAKHWVTSARWDGRYAWIANPNEGIYLLDAAGNQVALFDGQAGLPEGTWKILVQPLDEGRVIAAGTTRPDSRSWIAELWLDDQGRPRVQVIHAATRQSGWEDRQTRQADPNATASYEWIWLWDRGEAGRHLIVGRTSGWPLVVNLANHQVTVIGPTSVRSGVVNPFWGVDQRWYSFHMLRGADGSPTSLLLKAGTFGVALYEVGDEPVGPGLSFKLIDQWSARELLNIGNLADGRLIPRPDGSIIFSGHGGGGWGRIRVDPAETEPKLIVQSLSPARFPRIHGGSTAPATGHGLLVWGLRGSREHEGKVLRLLRWDATEEAALPGESE